MTVFCIKGGIAFTLFAFSINFAFSEINANDDMNETLQGINRIVHSMKSISEYRGGDEREPPHLSGEEAQDDGSESMTDNALIGSSEAKLNQRADEEELNKLENKTAQSSLLGRYTILSNQLSSDGKHTITLKVNVSDKKGRVALGAPVVFRVNNGAVPSLFNTLTNISGDAIFEFVNYHRGNMLVSVEFGGQDLHIPIFLK